MRILFLFSLILSSLSQIVAQKPPVDTAMLGKWPMLNAPSINLTNDGQYILYSVDNLPTDSHTLITQSTDGKWKKEWIGAGNASVSEDNKWAIFKTGDSLCILRLGAEDKIYIPYVTSYSLIQRNGKTWITYVLRTPKRSLVLQELGTDNKEIFDNILTYSFSGSNNLLVYQQLKDSGIYSLLLVNMTSGSSKQVRQGNGPVSNIHFSPEESALLYIEKDISGDAPAYSLHWVSFNSDKDKIIYTNKRLAENIIFDPKGQQIIFAAGDSIWYCAAEMSHAQLRISNSSNSLPENYRLLRRATFGKGGETILFNMQEKSPVPTTAAAVPVTIWSTSDEYLQTSHHKALKAYTFQYNISDSNIIRLEEDGESAIDPLENANKYALVAKSPGIEWWWRKAQQAHISLVSLQDGSRNIFDKQLPYSRDLNYMLSPGEHFIIYYDPYTGNYFSFEIATKITRNITANLHVSWEILTQLYTPVPDPNTVTARKPVGIAGWLENDKWVLIYDQHDIWQIDPSCKTKAINLTRRYGKMHNITFTISNWVYSKDRSISDKADHILKGFTLQGINNLTKDVGFYRQNLDTQKLPTLLLKGSYSAGSNFYVIPAEKGNIWIIGKSNPTTAPNLYATQDWIRYMQISDVHPEKNYNWYTTELVNWKLPNGLPCQGILFKPENIDTTKQYPLIFDYYEGKSNGLNYYHLPDWMGAAEINIPYFVSRGYLVFMPDIHIKIGYPGASALQSVVSAAKFLSQKHYVDKSKMGLMGHSYGGFETNYIISHTNIFAAAAEGAGMTDLISKYGSINFGGISNQWDHEILQTRIGNTIWKRLDLYIENSPIFKADKVTTPLLILHNKLDEAVPWQQGIEWFTALRRLAKKAWILQYDGESHSIGNLKNKQDYTNRLLQFFDYYLKQKPKPIWMGTDLDITPPIK